MVWSASVLLFGYTGHVTIPNERGEGLRSIKTQTYLDFIIELNSRALGVFDEIGERKKVQGGWF